MRTALVSLILFLSGSSALLFQSLWLHLSGLAFGNSIWAAALILSSFMAGLALGGAIAAAHTPEQWRPLRVYAGLEVAVALFGCTIVFALPLLGEWMRPLFQALWLHQGLLSSLRFCIAFLILLVPATAIGLTLPVLLDDPLLARCEFDRTLGILYGFNTLGAVGGALLGETLLIREFGLLGTGLTAGCLSCTAAAIAWLFATGKTATAEQPAKRFKFHLSLGRSPSWRLLFISLGTGAILLALEVIWFRFMRLYVASTSTVFCVMLAVVLVGIGSGSIASSLIAFRFAPAQRLLPILLLLGAIGTLLSYILFPIPALPPNVNAFHIDSWRQIGGLSFALMFPVAFLSGMLFPTVLSCIQREVPGRMNSAGLALLFNTAGAAFGPLLVCFVLLPAFGFQSSLLLCVAAYAGLAILASEWSAWSFRRPLHLALPVLVTVLILILVVFPYHRDETHFANARRPYEADGSKLIKRIEGTADTLQLLRCDLLGEPYYYRLITNAYSMSGTLPRSQRYMRLFAYLPLALHPEAENALLICYGMGVTADALIRDPRLKHLDVVDISREVFDLANLYSGPDYSNPLRDPRVTAFVQDGRFFLQAAPNRYDIITGEPPPLKVTGTVNLYTEQFFSLINDRLKDGGIVTFWLPIYQLTTAETKAILHAFHNVFANASVWASSDLEWIMIGVKGTLPRIDANSANALWRDAGTRSDLMRIGVEEPAQMSALFLMDGDEIDRITQSIEPLTDFYPKRLTDVQPDLKATHDFAYPYFERSAALRRFLSSKLIKETWPEDWKQSLELFFGVRETRYLSEISGSNWLAELDLYLRHTRLRTPVLAVQNSDEFRQEIAQRLASSQRFQHEAQPDLVAGALARRDLNAAIQLLESERDRGFTSANDFFLLVYLYCLNGAVEKAEGLAAEKKGSIEKDWFVEWLWGDLQAQYGFHPPF